MLLKNIVELNFSNTILRRSYDGVFQQMKTIP